MASAKGGQYGSGGNNLKHCYGLRWQQIRQLRTGKIADSAIGRKHSFIDKSRAAPVLYRIRG